MKRNGRILIVDDDATSVDILTRLLHKEYLLKAVTTGNECLAELTGFQPHVVLLDIVMPGINGHETCRRIKFSPLGDAVRIILVSGKETIVDHVRGSDALADDYVLKPFDHDVLLAKVEAQFEQIRKEGNRQATANAASADTDSQMSQQQQARLAAALRRLNEQPGRQLDPTAR
jgi:DNA-binding response OmpR family regulator